MRRPRLVSLVNRLLVPLRVEVRRATAKNHNEGEHRASVRSVLEQARTVGFAPATVLDIGAGAGTFTVECHQVFPQARYILAEPLQEYSEVLETMRRSIPNLEVLPAAVTRHRATVSINVHRDLFGSSLYREREGGSVDGVPRTVAATTLDDVADRRVTAPVLLKVDVQGAELDVLAGGPATLRLTEFAILEVSLFGFFDGGPQFVDVVNVMRAAGFVPYDVAGLLYRPLDGALAQVDLAFVREDSLFRRHHEYATPAQRAVQDARLRESLSALVGGRPKPEKE